MAEKSVGSVALELYGVDNKIRIIAEHEGQRFSICTEPMQLAKTMPERPITPHAQFTLQDVAELAARGFVGDPSFGDDRDARRPARGAVDRGARRVRCARRDDDPQGAPIVGKRCPGPVPRLPPSRAGGVRRRAASRGRRVSASSVRTTSDPVATPSSSGRPVRSALPPSAPSDPSHEGQAGTPAASSESQGTTRIALHRPGLGDP